MSKLIIGLFVLVFFCSSAFSLSVITVHKNESYNMYITMKDKDVKPLTTESKRYETSQSFYITMKDKDVKPLGVTTKRVTQNHSIYVFVNYNKETFGEKVIYFDIQNDTYKQFLKDNMMDSQFVDNPTLANIRIIINNESTDFFGFDTLGLHYGYERWVRPFAALVVSKNNTIYIYGNSVVGIVNGLDIFLKDESRFLNTDYVSYYDDKSLEGLKRWDEYIANNKNLSVILKVHHYKNTDYNLSTINGLKHRVRHLTSTLSTKYIDGTIGNDTNTIVIACGLWGNLTSWDNLAIDLVDSGYDVYQIEITGGTYTECDNCFNYDFDYLTDYAWPDMIGFVQSKTNKNLTYIAHSNGGRTALSSLDKWGNSGRLFNENGFYNMSQKPIEYMIGVGIPGAFEGDITGFGQILNATGHRIQELNTTHVSYSVALSTGITKSDLFGNYDESKISKNLFNNYYGFIRTNDDLEPGYNTSINKFTLIYSNLTWLWVTIKNDGIVTQLDEDKIFENINSSDKNKYLLTNKIHTDMTKDKEIDILIKERLRDE
jgi:hypothetical protein